jgi:hypothetical protein
MQLVDYLSDKVSSVEHQGQLLTNIACRNEGMAMATIGSAEPKTMLQMTTPLKRRASSGASKAKSVAEALKVGAHVASSLQSLEPASGPAATEIPPGVDLNWLEQWYQAKKKAEKEAEEE